MAAPVNLPPEEEKQDEAVNNEQLRNKRQAMLLAQEMIRQLTTMVLGAPTELFEDLKGELIELLKSRTGFEPGDKVDPRKIEHSIAITEAVIVFRRTLGELKENRPRIDLV